MTDIALSVTPTPKQSFVGKLTISVSEITFLAKIATFTDGANNTYVTENQQVVNDGSYLYFTLYML